MPWRESATDLARARDEQPIVFDVAGDRVFGIYTPADPAAPAARHAIVLFTRPRSHRNRMWIEAARLLASLGFPVFRFDYHGTGDSEGESRFLDPNRPHRHDANAAIRTLRERFGHERFLVMGACFDARTAMSTFVDEGAAVDGLVFFAAPVMELDTLVKAHADRKDWKHLLRALTNAENWQSLRDPARWRYMATVVGRVATRGSRRAQLGRPEAAKALNDTPLSDSFFEHFHALVRSGKRALFVYGEDDAEFISFKVALETVFPRLTPEQRAKLEVEIWPEDVHGFLNMPMQRRSLERALDWFAQFHPHAAAQLPARRGTAASNGSTAPPAAAHATTNGAH